MNYRQMLSWVLAMLLSTVPVANGSAEGSVFNNMTEATFQTLEAGYRFVIKLDDKKRLFSLTAIWKGKEFKVPKEELPHLEDVDLRNVDILAPHDVAAGPQDSVILVMTFDQEFRKAPAGRKAPVGAEPEDSVRVPNVIRVSFHEGKFTDWEKAVSLGEDSKAWKLSTKNVGEAEVPNGKHESLENPYWQWNPPHYWTGP